MIREQAPPYCSVCRRPNYIIKVDHLPHKYKLGRQNGIKKWGGIPVDACIGKEVEYLINNGVIALGCCCGHEKEIPSCLIAEESVQKAIELGYDPIHFDETKWYIYLNKEEQNDSPILL